MTLLEILVATALMAALLVALWRMVSIYTSLRETGESHADRVAVVSVLTQQLEDDLRGLPAVAPTTDTVATAALHAAAAAASQAELQAELQADDEYDAAPDDDFPPRDAETPTPPASTAWGPDWGSGTRTPSDQYDRSSPQHDELARSETESTRTSEAPAPSRLYGDGTSLTLEHLDCETSRHSAHARSREINDRFDDDRLAADDRPSDDTSSNGDSAGVPVRLIRYWLAGAMPLVMSPEPVETLRDDDVLQDVEDELLADEEAAGLYREEIVHVRASASFVNHLSERGAGFADGSGDYASQSADEAFDDEEMAGEVSRNSYRLPNVEWARFRYFDGNNWQATWDSRVEGQLPVAIEMNLWLESRKKREAASDAAPRDASLRTSVHVQGTSGESVDTWPARDYTREETPEYQTPLAGEETPMDDATNDGAVSELSASGPMERRPEVRQLVVLRAAPPQPAAAPSLDRAQFLGSPRRSLNLAPALP